METNPKKNQPEEKPTVVVVADSGNPLTPEQLASAREAAGPGVILRTPDAAEAERLRNMQNYTTRPRLQSAALLASLGAMMGPALAFGPGSRSSRGARGASMKQIGKDDEGNPVVEDRYGKLYVHTRKGIRRFKGQLAAPEGKETEA